MSAEYPLRRMALPKKHGESLDEWNARNDAWLKGQPLAAVPDPRDDDEPLPEVGPENLPWSFWSARPALARVHLAAQSRMVSPDAVLGAVLARLSSFVPPQVRVETGLRPASLNVFTALVGTSSAGKSLANATARDLLPVPASLTDYRDSLPLGSGEGMAEAFYGMQDVVVPAPNGKGTKTVKQRAIVRDRVSFYVDEGEALSRLMERSGSTIGQVLRTAWTGGMLGQANASAERNREVPEGAYSLGLVIGYQRATVRPMLADGGGGTPQRFLFLSAHAEPPEDEVGWPGTLEIRLPTSNLVLPKAARAELWHARRESQRPGAEEEGLNGHRPLHLSKMAALLAVLDGRARVTDEDWSLAWQVWRTSCTVRDALVREAEHEERERQKAREDAQVRTAQRSSVASHLALQRVVDAEVERVARWLAMQVHRQAAETGMPSTLEGRGGLKTKAPSRDRHLLPQAADEAEGRGWIGRTESGALLPGSSRPS